MRSMRRVGMWAAAVVVVVGAAGCGGDDGGGGGGGKGAASKPAASASAMSVDEALDAYQGVAAGGCTDAPGCQELMEGKLRAAKDLRVALAAEDRAAYAEPIRLVRQAERLAEHYGPEGLGSRGGFAAVNAPLQQAVAWLATNR
ncbi:hypothetical protein ACH4TX_41795 [Streptomyces sp. NPDC021098]|uniref:hypothetical protein n=1 Tax=unclassified Streptomyces TaxID=2593676 RepID=UPI003790C946